LQSGRIWGTHRCFIFLLCCLLVNNEKAKIVLHLDKSTITEPHFVWPRLSDEEWIKVKVAMKDLIPQDFGKHNSVNIASLTISEIRAWSRDCSTVGPTTTDGQTREQCRGTEPGYSCPDVSNHLLLDVCVLTNLNSQTTNVYGDIIQTITTTNYEQESFSSKSDWLVRVVSATPLTLRL